ncbi:MAG: shikimate dehydrogenase [Candidatus Firestonebacteria bacterium]|mgnify:CR=1 FL=1
MISGDTKLTGVFGYPVKHSLSPAMHNAAFKYAGLNYVYVPYEVKPENLKTAIKSLPYLNICGVNLTIPHKEKVLLYLDEISKEARFIGAVNTVKVIGKKLVGYNTDISGFLMSLKKDAKINPKDKNIVVLGAGGAAKAVCFAFVLSKAKNITIVNRTLVRAKKLALVLNNISRTDVSSVSKIEFCSLDSKELKEAIAKADILVNTTSVGLKSEEKPVIDCSLIHSNMLVYDLIYNPSGTQLLSESKKRGAQVMNGLGMLLYQGAISWQIWTGKKAPVNVMRQALLNRYNE